MAQIAQDAAPCEERECFICCENIAVAKITEYGFHNGMHEIDVCRQCMAKHTSHQWRKEAPLLVSTEDGEVRVSADYADLDTISNAISDEPVQFCDRCGTLISKKAGCSKVTCARCQRTVIFAGYKLSEVLAKVKEVKSMRVRNELEEIDRNESGCLSILAAVLYLIHCIQLFVSIMVAFVTYSTRTSDASLCDSFFTLNASERGVRVSANMHFVSCFIGLLAVVVDVLAHWDIMNRRKPLYHVHILTLTLQWIRFAGVFFPVVSCLLPFLHVFGIFMIVVDVKHSHT